MLIVVETCALNYRPRPLPEKGEVWLLVERGMLYEMRERSRDGSHWSCHRVGAPERDYGCDPTVFCACWVTSVHEGRWVRVLNCPPTAT